MVLCRVELIQLEEHQLFTLNGVIKAKKTENTRWCRPETIRILPHCRVVCAFSQQSLKKIACWDALSDHTHTLGP